MTEHDSPQVEYSFAKRMLEVVNNGFLSLMLSIGHRTGLFRTLASITSARSAEIARRAGLHERYVREWLGAMVAGGIVRYDPVTHTYALPPGHAAVLTSHPQRATIAGLAGVVSMLGEVEERLVAAFATGDGIGYEAFPRYHEVMYEGAEAFANAVATRLLPAIPGLEDGLRAGWEVADVACGCGQVLLRLAPRFPRSRFIGFDASAEAVSRGTSAADRLSLPNISFRAMPVDRMKHPTPLDLVLILNAVHDLPDPLGTLRALRDSLSTDGILLMADFALSSRLDLNVSNPFSLYLYTISTMHCIPVSLAQGGEGLGACWGEDAARQLLLDAGFIDVQPVRLSGNAMHIFFLAR